MRQFFYQFSFFLIALGAILPIFQVSFLLACICFSIGIIGFVPLQYLDKPQTTSFILKRLRKQQVLGCIGLIITNLFMYCHFFHIRPFTGDEWKIALAISVILETYTIFRIDYIEKHSKTQN